MSLEDDGDDTIKLLHAAMEHGINFFDTADLYQKGLNEEILGKAFHLKRDRVVLASKVGNQWRSDHSGWDWNPGKQYILESVEKSLKRLKTDYLDLYQLHGGTIADPIDDTIEAFEILKEQGKIRWYGISSIRPNVIREYVKRSNIVSVMMQYSLLDRRPEEEAFALLKKNHIGVLTRGNLASGLLVDKPAKPYLTYTEDEVNQVKNMVTTLSTKRTATDTALQFTLRNDAVSSAVIGIRTMKQLEQSIQALASNPFSPDEIQTLRNSLSPLTYQDHR